MKHFIERAGRRPLYVQVVTDPPLRACWSVNLSGSGIGLVATTSGPHDGPREGEALDLEFTLPPTGARLRVRGEVRWRHDGAPEAHGGTAIGVSFQRFEGSDQVKLARYLLSYQLSVVVAFPSEGDVAALRAGIEDDVQLVVARTDEAFHEALSRGDLAAVVVAGDPERALALLEQAVARAAGVDGAHLSDLASRVVLCAPLPPERLLSLFNAGRVFRAFASGAEPGVGQAVLDACRAHGERVEQERMALEVERNLARERPRARKAALEGEPLPGMHSEAMRRALDLLRVAAPHKVAVLLQGETGTGKEVLAKRLHQLSARAHSPFVVQDCGALTETLLESELFGHVKGSFTGAVADHPGLFVLADHGTIFLDEIENTSANLQAKLLRVIESGEVRPVGGTQVRQVDVRVVAASNRDLTEEVRAGRFRSDLFYRLNTFTVNLPPLRERGRDVLELAAYFIEQLNARLQRTCAGLTPEAEEALLRYAWPGNVRELRNVLERAVLLCAPAERISPSHLPEPLWGDGGAPAAAGAGSLRDRVDRFERELIHRALVRHQNVLRRAAAELRTDPVTLGRKARRHGLWQGR